LLSLVFSILALGNLSAQNSKTKNVLSFKFLITDYNTVDPVYRRYNSTRYIHPDDINYRVHLGYVHYLNSSLDLSIGIKIGSIDAHHNLIDLNDSLCIDTPCEKRYYRDEFVVGIYKLNNGYILPEEFIFCPYLFLGINTTYMQYRKEHIDLQLPMGLGVNIGFNPLFYFQIQADYRQSLLIKKNNIAITAGFLWTLASNKMRNKEK